MSSEKRQNIRTTMYITPETKSVMLKRASSLNISMSKYICDLITMDAENRFYESGMIKRMQDNAKCD